MEMANTEIRPRSYGFFLRAILTLAIAGAVAGGCRKKQLTREGIAQKNVREYLQTVLHDPASYESIWFSAIDSTNLTLYPYSIKHKYRSNNILGVPVVEEGFYLLSDSLTLSRASDAAKK